jgi:hypothetical protein
MAGVPLRSSAVVAFVMAVATVFAQTSTQQTSTQQTPISVPTPTPQAAPEVTTGIILGRTVDGSTGKAVGGALVTLTLAAPPQLPGSPASPASPSRQPARVISDGEGRFVFSGLPKGVFTFVATKPGYPATGLGRNFATDTGSQSLVLGEAERRGDLTLKFWKDAALAGTVLDEAGEPVVGIQVRVLKRTIVGGRPMFTQYGNVPTTDDRGRYRVASLQPGDYTAGIVVTQTSVPTSLQDAYAAANKGGSTTDFNREMDRSGGGILESDTGASASGLRFGSWLLTAPTGSGRTPVGPAAEGGRIFVYPTVYYPTSPTPSKATIVTLGSGEERLGVDFQLRPAITSRVSGTLVGLNGPEAHTVLKLFATGAADLQRDGDAFTAQTTTDSTGAFLFLGVTPGAYTIRVLKIPPRPVSTGGFSSVVQVGNSTIYSGGGGLITPPPIPPDPTTWASQAVSVSDTDVTGVVVALRTGVRLSGTLKFEGAAEPPPDDRLVQITVQVDPADGRVGSLNQSTISRGVVDNTGQFRTYQFPPGRYLVRAQGAPPGWTFKTATLGGRDVSDAPLDLGSEDVANIVITFTDHPSELAGAARDAKGPDGTATVLVFPATPALWNDNGLSPRRFRRSRVGVDGAYRIANLPAGDYWVVAVRSATSSEWLDPKFLQKLSALATKVTIADGEKKSLDVETKEVR